mmetsp:Transcript_3904/g.5767  ORF Transcript_3904/g.5767 Transcript_3904/m.5767 type:complete len:94 (+) Transcript_3904:467-748(+)
MMKDDNHSCSSDIISSNEKESMSTTSISDGMTDKPGDSSAAQCIEFCSEFPSKITSFRPEFTHQCFEGEWIKGYAPMKSLDQQQLNHKTYVKH